MLLLPNLGFKFAVASAYAQKTEEEYHGGLKPDVKVDIDPVKAIKGEDQVLKKALGIIDY